MMRVRENRAALSWRALPSEKVLLQLLWSILSEYEYAQI
jgi:hypothetical protein